MPQNTYLGEVLKTFGADGKLLIKANNEIDLEEPVFVFIDGLSVPFFFKSAEPHGHKYKAIFYDIESEEHASELVGKKLYTAPHISDNNDNVFELIDFKTVDLITGLTGIVKDFYDYPGNPCIEIATVKGDILIPINADFVKSINKKDKTITMEMPEGLTEI